MKAPCIELPQYVDIFAGRKRKEELYSDK